MRRKARVPERLQKLLQLSNLQTKQYTDIQKLKLAQANSKTLYLEIYMFQPSDYQVLMTKNLQKPWWSTSGIFGFRFD